MFQIASKHVRVSGLVTLLGAMLLASSPVRADVVLTRADVDALLNRVELIPRGRTARAARLSDFLGIGDALRTAAASRAELRFNDGSLARVGERATFRFTPNTRNFRLSNGTVLLLIPPGQGRTTIQTPNAVTGIQGSALVVRHIPGRDLTLVMALTNNPAGPMTVTTEDGSQATALYAGQMALIQQNTIQVTEFDLGAFYQTSDLVEGLSLNEGNSQANSDDPLQAVRQETLQALDEQTPFRARNNFLDPQFIRTDELTYTGQDNNQQFPPKSGALNEITGSGLSLEIPPGLVTATGERIDEPVSTGSGSDNPSGCSTTPADPARPADPGGPGVPATPATPATPAITCH